MIYDDIVHEDSADIASMFNINFVDVGKMLLNRLGDWGIGEDLF